MKINREDYLNSICKKIKYKDKRKSIYDELETHIEETKNEFIRLGFSNEQAEEQALKEMGDSNEIAKSFNKIYKVHIDYLSIIIILILLFTNIFITNMLVKEHFIQNVNSLYINIFIGCIMAIPIFAINYKKLEKYAFLIFSIGLLFSWISYFIIQYKLLIDKNIIDNPIYFSYISILLYIIAYAGIIRKYGKSWKTLLVAIISIISLVAVERISLIILLTITYLIMTANQIPIKENKRFYTTLFSVIVLLTTMFVGILALCENKFDGPIKTILTFFDRDTQVAIMKKNNNNEFELTKDFTTSYYSYQKKNEILSQCKLFGRSDSLNDKNYIGGLETENIFLFVISYLGWIPSIILLILIISIIIKTIKNITYINDNYGRLISIGIISYLLISSILSILISLNLFPIANIALPFISTGNINILFSILALSICLSIYSKKDILKIDSDYRELIC